MNSRDALMTTLCTIDLPIVDDFALEPMSRDESRDVYQLFVERNARVSTILAQIAVDRFCNNAYERRGPIRGITLPGPRIHTRLHDPGDRVVPSGGRVALTWSRRLLEMVP